MDISGKGFQAEGPVDAKSLKSVSGSCAQATAGGGAGCLEHRGQGRVHSFGTRSQGSGWTTVGMWD